MWTLNIYSNNLFDSPSIFDMKSKKAIEDWCYKHIVAALIKWDDKDRICNIYLGGGKLK